jgi:hypothetical protein
MSLTLLILGGGVLAITAAYMMTSSRSAIHTALAGQTATGGQATAVGLKDAGADTLPAGGVRTPAGAEWQLTTVNDLTAAEELLDCLENQGVEERELVVLGNSCFAVRWR